ncbi:MAG TPA: hypothetical protein VKB38_16330 [Terracidiphilus sp.]|nr:hypothetical protein [Terracidiphilus sp.]
MQGELEATRAEAADQLTTEQLKSAWLSGAAIEFGDPALAHAPMPLRETYFPLGFPVEISTNSAEVLDVAAESWASFPKMFDVEPVRIKVGVTSTTSSACPPTPVCRVRDHIVTNIADGENFAITDLSSGYSLAWITTAALRSRGYFRYFFLDSAALCSIGAQHVTAVHAACVSLDGRGILFCGESGAGKSTLSYACARSGWTYVTDDGSYIVRGREDRLIVGDPGKVRFRPTAEQLFPELAGYTPMRRAGVGKPSVELATRLHPAIATSSSATVHQIVFLNRKSKTQELAAFPTAVARLYMLQPLYAMAFGASAHEPAIDRILRVGAYELRYHDLDWAVERLTLLAREGR